VTTFTLTPAAPFDVRHTLAALTDFASSPSTRLPMPTSDGFRLRQAWRSASGQPPCPAVIEAHGAGAGAYLKVTTETDLSAPQRAGLARAVTLGLDLELDPAPLEGVDDPAFQPVLAALRGYHPPRFTSPFEAVCWALVRQRTPRAFAVSTMVRLVELLGEHVITGSERLSVFPEPAALTDRSRPALLAATNNTRKVDRLVGAARAFATVDPEWLQRAAYQEVHAWLLTVPGAGPWTAEFVLWRGLGRFERVPWTDTAALEAISRVYTAGFTIARGSARELAERYGWLQGLWLHYLKRYVFTLELA